MTEFPRVAVLSGGSGGPALRAVITGRGYRLADDEGGRWSASPSPGSTAALPAGAVDAVRAERGLVVLAASGPPAAAARVRHRLLAKAGIAADRRCRNRRRGRGRAPPNRDARAEPPPICWPGSTPACCGRPGHADIHVPAARCSAPPTGASAVLAAVSTLGAGRVVVIGVDGPRESAGELLLNAVAFASPEHRRRSAVAASGTAPEPAWLRLKRAVTELQAMQDHDGAVPSADDRAGRARRRRGDHLLDHRAVAAVPARQRLPGGPGQGLHPMGGRRLRRCPTSSTRCVAFHPERDRVDGREHLVVFPMYTQNGSPDRHVEAVLVQVIWPEFVADLEAGGYSQQAVRADPVPRLHRRLRHQLRRAVPGNRCHAGGPEVHLGRDLRRPGGRPVPPGGRAPPPRSPAWRCRRTPRGCWRTSS